MGTGISHIKTGTQTPGWVGIAYRVIGYYTSPFSSPQGAQNR